VHETWDTEEMPVGSEAGGTHMLPLYESTTKSEVLLRPTATQATDEHPI
jgi:hypothetical protein